MEKNILKGAKFGDKFVTRDGCVLLYIGSDVDENHTAINDDRTYKEWYWFVTEGVHKVTYAYDIDGLYRDRSYVKISDNTHQTDIVSRYQEPIDENKIDELAEEVMDKMITLCDFDNEHNRGNRCIFKSGFKAGYRKAMEE